MKPQARAAWLASLGATPAFAGGGRGHGPQAKLTFGFRCTEDNLIPIWDNICLSQRTLPRPGPWGVGGV